MKLLDYVIFAQLLFYVLTVAAVFVMRSRSPDAPRPYRAHGATDRPRASHRRRGRPDGRSAHN
jgi:hypothetical protein